MYAFIAVFLNIFVIFYGLDRLKIGLVSVVLLMYIYVPSQTSLLSSFFVNFLSLIDVSFYHVEKFNKCRINNSFIIEETKTIRLLLKSRKIIIFYLSY